MADIVVAIDGYSACGKSTTAKLVAEKLKYAYVDTGAMYRAVTLYFLENKVNALNKTAIEEALSSIHIQFSLSPTSDQFEIQLNDKWVEDAIRKVDITNKVSVVSALPAVRDKLTAIQRLLGEKKKIVMDGRDIGTTVFPEAELKIFMQAEMETRAKRRLKELLNKGIHTTLEEVLKSIDRRDHLDSTRKQSPLTKSLEAIILDTTSTTIDEQVNFVVEKAQNLINS